MVNSHIPSVVTVIVLSGCVRGLQIVTSRKMSKDAEEESLPPDIQDVQEPTRTGHPPDRQYALLQTIPDPSHSGRPSRHAHTLRGRYAHRLPTAPVTIVPSEPPVRYRERSNRTQLLLNLARNKSTEKIAEKRNWKIKSNAPVQAYVGDLTGKELPSQAASAKQVCFPNSPEYEPLGFQDLLEKRGINVPPDDNSIEHNLPDQRPADAEIESTESLAPAHASMTQSCATDLPERELTHIQYLPGESGVNQPPDNSIECDLPDQRPADEGFESTESLAPAHASMTQSCATDLPEREITHIQYLPEESGVNEPPDNSIECDSPDKRPADAGFESTESLAPAHASMTQSCATDLPERELTHIQYLPGESGVNEPPDNSIECDLPDQRPADAGFESTESLAPAHASMTQSCATDLPEREITHTQYLPEESGVNEPPDNSIECDSPDRRPADAGFESTESLASAHASMTQSCATDLPERELTYIQYLPGESGVNEPPDNSIECDSPDQRPADAGFESTESLASAHPLTTHTCAPNSSECKSSSRFSTSLDGDSSTSSDDASSTSSDDESSTSSDPYSSDDDVRDPDYIDPINTENREELTPFTLTPNEIEPLPSEKQSKSRKRKSNEKEWSRNKAKILRSLGKPYVSTSKTRKNMKERNIGPPCTDKCRLKCSGKISQENRQIIFKKYWAYGDTEKQRNFIASSTNAIKPRYRYIRVGIENENTKNRKPRNSNSAFHFDIEGSRVRVCKTFFKSTLGINDRPIRTVLGKKDQNISNTIESDKRGKHPPSNKTDTEIIKGIKEHIDSIPRVPSHFCRSNSTREYIDGGLTVAELHRNYTEICKEKNISFAKYSIYYRTFMTEYNISFHRPKKDQCEDCIAYANCENKEILQEKFDQHLKEKELCRKEKEVDKKSSNITAVYDLEAVLQCPRGESSNFYYVSKINVFNFTICQLQNKEVDCFVWHEGQAGRGANEIGSCLWKFLQDLDRKSSGPFNVILYSDNCCGQQKNKFITAMYAYAVLTIPNLNSITHKFLIKGHSQNEGDAVHSVIEGAIKRHLKSGSIYTPDQYITLIRTAKKTGKPYNVHELDHTSFHDLKALCTNLGANYKVDHNKSTIKTGDIKVMKFQKDSPGEFFVKTSYADQDYRRIQIRSSQTRKNTRSVNETERISTIVMETLNNCNKGIPSKKKEGLLNLIRKRQIPSYYKDFYDKLKSF